MVQRSDLRVYRFGAGEGSRTPDLLITSEPLCRLSYPGVKGELPQPIGSAICIGDADT